MSDEEAARRLLGLPLPENDAGAATVAEYLAQLVRTVWRQGEGFSGKRPFGNSGWQYDLYTPMAAAGLVAGEFDTDGYLEQCDTAAADALVEAAITALAEGKRG